MSLNSKKSWHPSKAINQAKVAKREQDKAEQLSAVESERQALAAEQELLDLHQQVSTKDANGSKVAWMYANAPKSSAKPPVEENKEDRKPASALDPRKLGQINAADPFAQILRTKKPQRGVAKRTR